MQKKLNVSVVIVTHNRAERIVGCISSIAENTSLPKDIVVVDDGNIEKTCHSQIISLRKKFLRLSIVYKRIYPTKGVSYSRNAGITLSKGRIIAFVDDDCFVDKSWIQNIVISHKKFPNAAAITGLILPVFPHNYWNKVLYTFHQDNELRAKKTNFLFGANYTFKSDIFFKHNLKFNPLMIHCSEDRFISFLLEKNKLLMIYDPKIIAYHDFRTTIKAVFKQWLRYGVSDYFFWELVSDYKSKDALYFRTGDPFKKLIKAPFRTALRIQEILKDLLNKEISDVLLIPGLTFIFLTYFLGVYMSYFRRNLLKKS